VAAAENGRFLVLLDSLLRGPMYIVVVGVLLAGIVFFNVDLLKMNHGIARTDIRAGQLKRENALLTLELARLGSSERIQRVALERGLVLPQPGDVQYLEADRRDARLALRVMTAPNPSIATAAAPPPVSQVSATPQVTAQAPVTQPPAATQAAPTGTATPTG
jgi:cell division protein FtsL